MRGLHRGLHPASISVFSSPAEIEKLDHIISMRQAARRGSSLYRIGNRFRNLYAVRTGALKTIDLSGEMLGLDASSTDRQNFAWRARKSPSASGSRSTP